MSIQELIDLNKLVFGESRPMISVFRPLGLVRPLTIIGEYDNVFLFTGCRSVLVYDNTLTSKRVYVPFDNYICLADVLNFTGDCKIVAILPQYSLMEDFTFADVSGEWHYEPMNDLTDICLPSQRGYFLTYPNTKIMSK